jgi:hypothetical protein
LCLIKIDVSVTSYQFDRNKLRVVRRREGCCLLRTNPPLSAILQPPYSADL